MAGMTTSTRCSAGTPLAKASRGKRRGVTDSLMRRLTTATTASEAGSSINNINIGANAPKPVQPLAFRLGHSAHSSTPIVPSINATAYKNSVTHWRWLLAELKRFQSQTQTQTQRCGHGKLALAPMERMNSARPAPHNQCCGVRRKSAEAIKSSGLAGLAALCMKPTKKCANSASLRVVCLAKASMRCSVWSRVGWSSAAKTGCVNISCMSKLLFEIRLAQSASPMLRNELTALLTLRLSAA